MSALQFVKYPTGEISRELFTGVACSLSSWNIYPLSPNNKVRNPTMQDLQAGSQKAFLPPGPIYFFSPFLFPPILTLPTKSCLQLAFPCARMLSPY